MRNPIFSFIYNRSWADFPEKRDRIFWDWEEGDASDASFLQFQSAIAEVLTGVAGCIILFEG